MHCFDPWPLVGVSSADLFWSEVEGKMGEEKVLTCFGKSVFDKTMQLKHWDVVA